LVTGLAATDLAETDLRGLALTGDGASAARSMRITGRMMTTAEAPGIVAGFLRN
jgi:hypothetical protein